MRFATVRLGNWEERWELIATLLCCHAGAELDADVVDFIVGVFEAADDLAGDVVAGLWAVGREEDGDG